MSNQYVKPFRSIDVDEAGVGVVDGAAQVVWLRMENRAAAERFVKFYDGLEADVVVGTTTPVLTIPMRAASGEIHPIPKGGLSFETGIVVAATTGIADADVGAPAANDVVVNLGYTR